MVDWQPTLEQRRSPPLPFWLRLQCPTPVPSPANWASPLPCPPSPPIYDRPLSIASVMSSSSVMHLPAVSPASHITRCALTDGHSPPFPPAVHPPVSLETPTLHDPASSTYSVDDILQIILKTRRSWKTLKGQSEAVWPPYLEATMLKALQEYEPDDSRETRMLGRYPMRNRFISDYIHSTTGKYRSAKQVSSRLQQLRDTAEGRELIDVLTRCHRTPTDSGTCNACVPVCHTTPSDPSFSPSSSTISCDSSPASSTGSPVTPTSPLMPRLPLPQSRQPTESRTPVYIDILPQHFPWSQIGCDPSSAALPTSTADPRASDIARHISNIDPTVTFVSPSPVNGISSYIVLLDGAPIHSEDTALEYAGPYFSPPAAQPPGGEPALYNTALVPRYWEVLCKAADPTLYTIVQDVYQTLDPSTHGFSQRARRVRIFSAVYHFRYPSSADSTPSYGQSPIETSSSGSSVTSAFGHQMLQSSASVEPSRGTSFPVAPAYASQAAEGPRTPSGVDQNLFDEPFMLDVNFDQISFDDIFINMDNNASDGGFPAHFFSKDPSGFM